MDATHATIDVTVTPGAALGARTVVMTTGSEVAQLVGGFTVTPGQPTLFSINPVSAIQGTNLTVILNGAFTNFTPQVTTAFFGAGISVGTVTVNGPTLASVPIAIAAGAAAGPRSVIVTTGSESVTLLNGFTVVQGTPTVTVDRPQRRAAGPDAERRHHGRVHELAEHRHVGELRGRHHRELERRELGDLADEQHHD